MSEKNGYISLMKATRYCDYSQEYLSLRARQGKLKAIKFGRNWVTKKEWLDDYLKHNSKKHEAEKADFKKALNKEINFPKLGIVETMANLFNQPKFRYAMRYAIAGVLVFCLIFTGIVFSKDAIWSVKDGLTKTSQELSGIVSNKKPSLPELPELSIPNISIPEIDLHPVQDFKNTMSFVAGTGSKGLSIISQKANNSLDKLTTIIGSSVINSKAVLDTSLANSTTFLNQFLIEINNSVYKWRKGEIVNSDKLEKETKGYFYNLGASVLLTGKNTYSFLAEAGVKAGDDLKYSVSIFQRFTQWYGEQALVVGQKIVNTGIVFRQGYQNTNDFVKNKIFLAWQEIKDSVCFAGDYIFNGAQKIWSYVTRPETSKPAKQGIVVIPPETDEETKKKIERAFSDEVIVELHEDKKSGIIKPIFKETKDQEYIYILAPIIESE
ncbi:MAG: hypothetical protein WBC21_02485 [Minisyncoccales bacterium]